MTRFAVFRSLAVALGAVSMVAACGGGGGSSSNLASDQTLSFPMVDDVGNTDPAHMSAAVDIDIFRNTYSGLYKFDDQLNQVPDIATGAPTISADGMTYTFKMKNNVKFSNGDPVKADDFIFSWDRAAPCGRPGWSTRRSCSRPARRPTRPGLTTRRPRSAPASSR